MAKQIATYEWRTPASSTRSGGSGRKQLSRPPTSTSLPSQLPEGAAGSPARSPRMAAVRLSPKRVASTLCGDDARWPGMAPRLGAVGVVRGGTGRLPVVGGAPPLSNGSGDAGRGHQFHARAAGFEARPLDPAHLGRKRGCQLLPELVQVQGSMIGSLLSSPLPAPFTHSNQLLAVSRGCYGGGRPWRYWIFW